MQAKLSSLKLSLILMSLQVQWLGLKVWMRERAYYAVTRYSFRTGLVLRAGDDGDDIEARIAAAVEEATAGLKTKNQELLAKVRKLQAGDQIDPKDVERLEAEVERLKADLSTANKSVKDLTKRAETAETNLAAEAAHTQRLIVDGGLTAALTEAGVTNPVMLKAAAALLRANKIDIAAEGDARVAKVGDKSLGDFVKTWAQGDEGKAFVAAPANGGGGARGNGTPGGGAANPWAKDTLSLTEQGRIFRENPTLARTMAAEHGVTL